MDSLAEPTVWSHEPVARLGSSLAVAPVLGSAAMGPILAAVWEASCCASAWVWVASPLFWGLLVFLYVVWLGGRREGRGVVYLVGRVAGHGTVGALGCAGGRVDVGAKGGGVAVVRHDCSRVSLMDGFGCRS